MSDIQRLKIYEPRIILDEDELVSLSDAEFTILNGSRMLVTLVVYEVTGTSLDLTIGNTFSAQEAYESIDTVSVTAPGIYKRVYSDFNHLFKFSVNVTGGQARYKVNIAVFDNASTTKIENAQLSVDLSDIPDATGHFDVVRVGDGIDRLAINPDGSINVVTGENTDFNTKSLYEEVSSVPSASQVLMQTYTAPSGYITYLQSVNVSGTNIATYELSINNIVQDVLRTYFGGALNAEFAFAKGNNKGLKLDEGDVVRIKVIHGRPDLGDFNSRLQSIEV